MLHDNRILVLGAGELGMAVLRNLVRRTAPTGLSVAVLLRPSTIDSRDPVKRKDVAELHSLGVELVPGDLADQSGAALATVFRRFDTVISCTGFVGGPGVQLKIARAALGAGVKRYFPWQFGVDYEVIGRGSAQDLFDEQLDVRDLLRSQERTEWVIVSTGMFTSFLFEPSFGVVDLARNTVNALGGWDNAVTVTTAEDIGAVTTEIVFATPRIANQVVHVAGDTVTFAELSALGGAGEVVLAQLSGDRPTVAQRVVAVGPEGGWSTEELASGLPTVGFGLSVLRAETAAVTAGALLASLRTGTVAAAGGPAS